MQTTFWHIAGKSYHFGRHGLGQEESNLHYTSDTLFSALICSLAEIHGESEIQAWMEAFHSSTPPFVLSSAFPRAAEVRFYPTPLHKMENDTNQTPQVEVKKLKRLRYLSEKAFLEKLKGEPLSNLIRQGRLLQNGTMLVMKEDLTALPKAIREESEPIFIIDRRPRVTIDRINSKSSIYFTGQTHFSHDCGLWFAIRWLSNQVTFQPSFEAALHNLEDVGIGGERSNGMGKASFHRQENPPALPLAEGKHWLSLSRYLPAADESSALLDAQAAYQLETVGGWSYSPGQKAQRRINLHMLTEGSVLGAISKAVPGQIIDVQPVYVNAQGHEIKPQTHPIWRNGLAFPVGITL